MKGLIKRIGRVFFEIKFRNYEIFNRVALIVDDENISKEHLNLALENTKKNFPYTHIVLLTLGSRKHFIGDGFGDIELKYPSEKLLRRRFQILLEMLKLRKRNLDLIVLTNLDITPVIFAMFFTRAQVLLYNKWNQWWTLRQKTVGDWLVVFAAPLWFIFRCLRNLGVLLYLLFSVFIFWLRRILSFIKT